MFDAFVRFHVLANDDSHRAQARKMRVVRFVRARAARITSGARDAQDAFDRIEQNKRKIRRYARCALLCAGAFENVRVETGVFAFPEKRYGDALFPAGEYRALRILLGDAKGANWWCVLYPDLCAVEESCAGALREFQNVQFYSSILDALRHLFMGG